MVATTNAIAKIAAVVAGLGLVATSFAAFAAPAKAATTDELQAQITALLAQIAALQGGSATASATFTMDLTLGSTGAEVTALQNWLISKGYSIPAGATGYFGAQTKAALAAYQAANGIAPAAGYFGPITRAKVNAAAGGSTGGNTGGNTGTGALTGGEASLGDVDGKSGEDDEVGEGETAEVAEFTFDVDDGDVRLNRVDLEFVWGGVSGEESKPWKTFDTISLLDANGKTIASEDVSDKDDWLKDKSPYVFRFTGLNHVIRQGGEGTIIVEVEARSSVKGSDTTIPWTVAIDDDGVRATDAEGLDQYTGDDSETVSFDVVEEGADDDLDVRSSTDDPAATTLKVETNKRSDWYTIFVFDLEAGDDSTDIDLSEIGVNFTTSDDNVSDVINDVKLVIDGESFTDFDWVSPAGTSASTTFDIDGDFTIDAGDRVPVEVMVQFKSLTAYTAGTTITASTTGEFITGEGANDITATGSATGETHTLEVSGVRVSPVSDSANAQVVDGADNDYATYTIKVDVEAFEQDVFISQTAQTAFTFDIENASTGAVLMNSTATSSSVTSNATTQGGYYRVSEGQKKTFTFTVTLNPLAADEGQQYRLQLNTIRFNSTAAAPIQTWTAAPAGDYETDGVLIND